MLKLLFIAASVCNATSVAEGDRQVARILAQDPSSGYTAKRGKLTPLGSKFLQFAFIYTSPLASIFQFAVTMVHMTAGASNVTSTAAAAGASHPSESFKSKLLEVVGSGSSLFGSLCGAAAFLHALAVRNSKFRGAIGAAVNLVLVSLNIFWQVVGTATSFTHLITHFGIFGDPATLDDSYHKDNETTPIRTLSIVAVSVNAGIFWLVYLPYVLHFHWHGAFGLVTIQYKAKTGYTRADCGPEWVACAVHLMGQSAGEFGLGLGSNSVTKAINDVLMIMTQNPDARNYVVQAALTYLDNSKKEAKNPEGDRALAHADADLEASMSVASMKLR